MSPSEVLVDTRVDGNTVTVVGNLTRDPELRSLQSGTSVCELRIAVNSSRKDESGNWVDKPNYFNVKVWGAQGENCATYLSKGRPVAIDGRLDWREWEASDGSGKRQTVEIIANSVQFLGSRDGGGEANQFIPETAGAQAGADFGSAGGVDDDIPF